MAINVSAITEAIKKAGATNVRVVPMQGQRHDGQQQIEVREGAIWRAIAEGLSPSIAQSLISQSTNRVICG